MSDGTDARGNPRPSAGSWTARERERFLRDCSAALRDADVVRRQASAMWSFADRRFPFWPAQVIVLAAIALDVGLPDKVTLGPRWLLPAFEGALVVGLSLAAPRPKLSQMAFRRHVAIAMIGLVSAANLYSLALMVHYLVRGGNASGKSLLLAGAVLWGTNILLFALWFWELDRGGPVARIMQPDATPDFLFPQMTDPRYAPEGWYPKLVDYLYVSFTNATAFSPTDTMPLTAVAKSLMLVQALASLLTVGLVVARAVNILA